jgi:C-terminal processing protease CtpA/Prc
MKKILITLILTPLIFNCSKNPVDSDQAKSYSTFFNKVWQDYDTHYSYFVYKNINWDSIKTVYEPLVQEKTTYDFFLNNVICPMIRELKDFHVKLYDKNGSFIPIYSKNIGINYQYNDGFYNRYLTNITTTANGIFKMGAIDDNIGYILIASWTNEDDVNEFLRFFENDRSYYENLKGLIIDVRPNGGGGELLARNVAERFTKENHVYAYRKSRNGPNHDDFTSLLSVHFFPSGSWQFTKPVMVLIGEQCASSNEAFILMMSTLKHVTLVGDTTRGSSGNPVEYSLEDGTQYTISSWVEYKPDRTVLEDVGIFPDVPILVSESIVDDRDMVLEKAIEVLNQ